MGPARPTQQGHRPDIINVLQLGNLFGLLHIPIRADLPLRHDRDVHDFVGELQQLDDLLRTRVHGLLCLSDRPLNDLFREISGVSSVCSTKRC